MLLETSCSAFQRVRETNATGNGTLSLLPTTTTPTTTDTATGLSVIRLSDQMTSGGTVQNGVVFMPYGLGNDNDAFKMRVYGWRYIDRGTATRLWIPMLLCDVTCTIDSTLVGIASAAIIETEFFADTITITGTSANDDVSIDIISPADGLMPAHFVLDLKGCLAFSCGFDDTTGTPSMNSLFALL